MRQALEEPPIVDWEQVAVVVRAADVPRLPALLRSVDLRAKQAAIAAVWSRFVWRDYLDEPQRARLPAPDAFDSTIEALRRFRCSATASGPQVGDGDSEAWGRCDRPLAAARPGRRRAAPAAGSLIEPARL